MSTSVRRRIVVLAALFVLALVVRLRAAPDDPDHLRGDEPEYHELAVGLLEGEGFRVGGRPTALRAPGLPAALAITYGIVGPDPAKARGVLGALGAAVAPALALLGLLLVPGTPAVGWTAGTLWAVYPRAATLSGLLYGETLAALLLTGGLVALVRAGKASEGPTRTRTGGGRVVLTVVGAVLTAVAVLTRPYLVGVGVVPIAWLLLLRRRVLAGIFAAVFVMGVGAWVGRNAVAVGYAGLSTQTREIWAGNNLWARGSWPRATRDAQMRELRARVPDFDALSEAERARVFNREGVREIREHPGRFLWLLPRKVAIFFWPSSYLGMDWVYLALLPLMALGAWRWVPRSRDRGTGPGSGARRGVEVLVLTVGPVAAVIPVVVLTFGDPRFRHPVDPFLFLLGAAGLVAAVRRVGATGWRWDGRPSPDAGGASSEGGALDARPRDGDG